MEKTESSGGGLSRRTFLRGTGAAVGALGLVGVAGMTTTQGWLAPAQANAEGEERIAYTYHQDHCHGHCSLKCTVRDGRLCVIEPNDIWDDKHFRAVCPKGLSEIQHVYSQDRVQTPLRRVGERGAGEFVPITWDEALDELSGKIHEMWDKYGKESVLFGGSAEGQNIYVHLQKILGAQGKGLGGFDEGIQCSLDPMYGGLGAGTEARDWRNAKTLLMTSCNYLESCMSSAKCFFEAQDAGCHIIVVDPNYSTTASKADEWVPIQGGTDAALFLGMCTVIVDNQWYDEDFLKENTTFPFLVDDETGQQLRVKPVEDIKKETGADNPYLVWDEEAQAAVAYQEAKSPALEGSYVVDGRPCTTVFELFKRNCQDYPVSWASQLTDIPEEKIVDLARQLTQNTPATISVGVGGSDKYPNCDIVGHAMGILGALAGTWGKPGAAVGRHHANAAWSGKLGTWELPEDMKAAKQEMAIYKFPKDKGSVKCVISPGDLFTMRISNLNVTNEWVKELEYIVCIEAYMTPTTAWSDLVLPASTRFETTEEVENVKIKFGHLLLQEKVIEPLFDSKPDQEIERLIAKAVGFGDVLPKNSVESTRFKIEGSTDKKLEGMTLEQLKGNQGVLKLPGTEKIQDKTQSQIEKTLSGRIHVYFDDMVKWNQALPVYEAPSEWYPENPNLAKYPLQFCQLRTKFFIHNQFIDATWIHQFIEPQVEMGAAEMAARGLKDGDMVRVFNDRGEFKCKAVTNEKMRPNTVGMVEGQWTSYMPGGGSFQNVTNDFLVERGVDLSRGPMIPVLDTIVQVEKA